LSGSGVVTGAVTLASGSVNPGSLGGAGTLTITNGDFTVTGGTLTFDLSNDATNGVNDLLVVNGNLDLNSPATISINKLNGNLGGGNYRLVKFSGALAGSLANLTLSGAGPLDVLQQNGNDNDLVVSPSATVTWTGGTAGNFWDIATSTNWLLNGVRAPFTNGEAALFNNTGGTNPVVTIPATVQPVAVFVSSSSNYTFTGAADIGSGASLTKSGTGTLTVLNANTFIGGSYLNGGILKLGDGATQNGSVAGNISDNATLVVANPADQTFSGVISGAGALIKQGAGTLTLNSANSLTGPTTISAGTLALGDGSSANGSLAGGPITNSSLLVLGEISSVTISNNIAGTGGIVNNSPASVILSGVISGTCKLTNDYSGGILHLTATNSYSGGTCINNGAVIVSDPTLHGVGSGDIVINDGSGALQFAGTGSNVFANNIQLPANSPTEQFSFQTITIVRLAGLLTGGYAGQITHFVNAIGSGSPGSILILDNPNNTFTTIPEVYLGTLQFTSDGALGDPANGISLNSAAHINTGFYSAALGGLQFGSNNITLNASRNLNLVGNENIDAQAFIGTIAGPVTGLGLHKLGSGTLRLTGSGSLTGATVISNGTLRVDCPWSGSSLIAVPGTTLMGTGVISAPITIQSGATLSPGASIGTLTVNTNLTLAAGSATLMELNAGTVTSDRVTGIGTLTYGGTLTVTKLAGTLGLGQSYPLFSATTYTGSFAATNLPALGGSLKWSWTPANGTLSVVSAMASYPTNLTAVVSGGNLNLSWPATHLGWFAQSNVVNVALSNFWFDIPGSQTATNLTVPINPALPQAYYRLRHP
jgi:autotransporter-associated beta strand protein